MSVLGPWEAIAGVVLALPPHQPLTVERARIPQPKQCGFYLSTGLERRCLHHYRYPLPDGRGLHVHSFRSHYLVHWDRVDPSVSVVRHFWLDVTRAIGRAIRRATREPVPFTAWSEPAPTDA